MIDLEKVTLKMGTHSTREEGVCAMEAVAWLAGEPHSDAPVCACPVLTQYVIKLNDVWNDAERQLLKPYLSRIIGTRDGRSRDRTEILAHRAGTVFAPITAEIGGRKDLADEMRAVPFGAWELLQRVCEKTHKELHPANAVYYAANAAYAAAYGNAVYAAAYAAANAVYYAANASDREKIIQESLSALDTAIEVK